MQNMHKVKNYIFRKDTAMFPTAWSISDRRIINKSLKQPQDR